MKILIVPLSRIEKKGNKWVPAPHTELKLRAVVVFLENNPEFYVVLQGGYNCGVRYNENEIIEEDFSFEAISKAREEESEANCGRKYLITEKGIKHERIMVEEISATSKENSLIANILLLRTTFKQLNEVRIFSFTHHLKKILPFYRTYLIKKFKIKKESLEKYLPIEEVKNYYSEEKDGKKWKVWQKNHRAVTVVEE